MLPDPGRESYTGGCEDSAAHCQTSHAVPSPLSRQLRHLTLLASGGEEDLHSVTTRHYQTSTNLSYKVLTCSTPYTTKHLDQS